MRRMPKNALKKRHPRGMVRMKSARCARRFSDVPSGRYKRQARDILLAAMQRLAGLPQTDITAAIVPASKRRHEGPEIIGREGRNIKSFEMVTGGTTLCSLMRLRDTVCWSRHLIRFDGKSPVSRSRSPAQGWPDSPDFHRGSRRGSGNQRS